MESILTNYLLPAGIYLIFIAFLVVIAMALWQVVKDFSHDPAGTAKSMAGVIALIVILLIIWQLSSPEKTGIFVKSKYADVTGGVMKFVGAGITSTVVMLVFSIVALIGAEIYNIFK
ncbi:hypothetical protein C7N43_12985 [Sphingobacteriales bacterium UPWRP_1]|nr:hypothetical protein BVG80_14485 [Sphingobacteriales bacterium TSM_CSM]PSJ76607.1 hypothetical protein C7N43_12985 [Sphingobacteriales bacterium UPWRP_1]